MSPPSPRPRARDLGLPVGRLRTGPHNAITDVPGVRVGHRTVWSGADGRSGDTAPVVRTGATAIWPHESNPFRDRVYAATSTFNGYGVLTGDLVIDEWGLLGSPVVLCDTANLGTAYDAVVRHREGSCIAVVATDLPLLPHQLRRLARRVDIGLGRVGSVGNDGSGEIFLAFSTAARASSGRRGRRWTTCSTQWPRPPRKRC